MSLGDGMVVVTVLILISVTVYTISAKKRWKKVGKFFVWSILLIIFLNLLGWGGYWVWSWYNDRPYELNGIGDITLNMSVLDLKLAFGEPILDLPLSGDDSNDTRLIAYEKYSFSDTFDYLIKFEDVGSGERMKYVCKYEYEEVFGLSIYSSEKEVLSKLGNPTNISIREDSLAKLISYEPWKVVFEIEKGDVNKICVSRSGKLTYSTEYSED